jgi:hypothetical protein
MTEELRPGMVVIAKGGWNFANINVGDLLLLVALHDNQPTGDDGDSPARWHVLKANGELAIIAWIMQEYGVQVVPGNGITISPTNEAL